MLETLRLMALMESPSLEKEPADRCCESLAGIWSQRGVSVEVIPQKHRGNHLRITYSPGATRAKSQLLVLGHYDTVYPVGTLVKMPFRVSAGKAYGPGVFDMKAGIVQALFALEALQNSQISLAKRIVFLWTSDEEIGSESSRVLLESEARHSDAVFVLEPSLGPRGLLKTSRKGVGEAKLTVYGRSSHAGLAPEKGINAIHELAAQVIRIEKWNNLRRGVSINADIIEGPKLKIRDGAMTLPEGPGLGVMLDHDKLARANEVYRKTSMRQRDDGSLMRKLEPGWTGELL